ncbi:transcriptional regulator with XRE-family HTH domain [Saccharothrix tamanrassetensis]|uniref:Transcriptional regulator with XRE-family HTH domain n=1 Tax=Saccharothrix tamanrassetensis TaxID=1051531 RepID=A0A841CE98_9PSEU|nr:helix-turn-helix domain-containing protein [Saccharothrix tamanrassetensis]MBB5955601.1 transcriptional regulator with XRE-family HTH domain [Saccharothrix tamanrassetensis]
MSTRQELGRFLRAHRELVGPADVGLAGTARRRRTPGLRREEVAALSGVGLAWYTWLEQGRVDTSRQVLDAVARALRLDADAHRHVLALAGLRAESPDVDLEVLRPLVDGMTAPAAVLDRRFDVVAANPAFVSLGLPDRNLVLALTHRSWRERVPEWEPLARNVFRQFRAQADGAPDDSRFAELLRDLASDRGDLAAWWECRAVQVFRTTSATVDGHRWSFALLRPGEDPQAGVLVLSATDRPQSG